MRYLLILVIALSLACASGEVKLFQTAEDQFEYAKKLYTEEKYNKAAEAFQTVIFRFHGTSLADSVTFYVGQCYYNVEDYILAVAEFKRLLQNYPNSPLADEAHYFVAKCYFNDTPNDVGLEQDGVKDAITTIDNFFEDFPTSPFRQNARDLLDSCYSRLAKKAYKNGEVYYKIGDYRAAKIYLEEVVTDYTQPEWVGKALFRLAEIDYKQKEYSESKAKLNNFLKAFPQHEWAEKANKKLNDVEKKLQEQEVQENERAEE